MRPAVELWLSGRAPLGWWHPTQGQPRYSLRGFYGRSARCRSSVHWACRGRAGQWGKKGRRDCPCPCHAAAPTSPT